MNLSTTIRRTASIAALTAVAGTGALAGTAAAATIGQPKVLGPGTTLPIDFAAFKEPANNKLPKNYRIVREHIEVARGEKPTTVITAPKGFKIVTIGFALDQQVPVQKAFSGPLALKERLGSIDAATLADADLEPVFRERPAIHRFPGAMAQRVHDLAVHVRDRYDGDAARVWTDAVDAAALRANLAALPGFGEMKIKAIGSVLAKRFGVEAAEELVPWHPTLGDVDSKQALLEYQAAKRIHKAEWSKSAAPASA